MQRSCIATDEPGGTLTDGSEMTMTRQDTVTVAAIQVAPTFFDRQGAVDKVCRLTGEAAGEGAELVVFPEAYVGGYPWGLAFGTAVGGRSEAGRRVWQQYWDTAVDVPGPDTERLGKAAADAGVYSVVGVVERDSTYGGVDAPTVLGWDEWRELEDQYALGAMKSTIEACMDEGSVRRGPVAPRAQMLLACLTEAGMLIARADDKADARKEMGEAVSIFMVPGSFEELRHRLSLRMTESSPEMKLRLKVAREELLRVNEFDYRVINTDGDLGRAVADIDAIISAEKCRVVPRRVKML